MIQDAFVALDFETANGKRTNIFRSVGMVKVIDSQITETFHTLVICKTIFHNKILKFMAYNQKMLKMHLRLTTYFHI